MAMVQEKILFKERLRQNRWLLIFLLVLAVLILVTSNITGLVSMTGSSIIGTPDMPADELLAGTVIRQIFQPAANRKIDSIAIFFATYNRTNQANLRIILRELPGGGELAAYDLKAAELRDNDWRTFILPKSFATENNRAIEIIIESIDGQVGSSPTLWLSKAAGANGYYVNDVQKPDLAMRLRIDYQLLDPSLLRILRILVWFVLLASAAGIIFSLGHDPAINFLIVFIPFGIFMVLLNPFYHPLDEISHFVKTYALTDGQILATRNWNTVGYMLPKNMLDILENKFKFMDIIGRTFKSQAYFDAQQVFQSYPAKYVAPILPIDYIPASVGVGLGRLLGLPAISIIYLGRLMNVLAFGLLAYLSIKRIPFGKHIMLLVALLPGTIYLAGSYSTDGMLIGGSMLFIAICLDYACHADEKCINLADLALLFTAAILILSVKSAAYAPILLFFFLIPKRCFRQYQYLLTMMSAAVILVFLFFAYRIFNLFSIEDDRMPGVNQAAQLSYIMANPLAFIKILFNDKILNGLVTSLTSYSYIHYANSLSSLLPLFMAGVALTDRTDSKDNSYGLTKRTKLYMAIFSWFAIIVIYVLVNIALYLGYSPVGNLNILGVQPRYFLPILPLLLLQINRLAPAIRISRYEQKVAFMAVLLLMNNFFALI